MTEWPRPLIPVRGPYAAAKIDGAAAGMGDYGDMTRRLVAEGLLPPDLVTGMTLALLARQPRKPRPDQPERASGVAGRVWVREQFTIHRPTTCDDPFVVTGESTGTYTKKGRSYSTTSSRSHTSDGSLFAANLTTGLFGYRADPALIDGVEGLPLEATPAPRPDWRAAADNPHVDDIRSTRPGTVFGGEPVLVTLAMMAARDTDNPDNPIHSDPEEARKAGLSRPIAGGSHVLAFAVEAVMRGLGAHCLLHGANFDIRWKAPTEDGVTIIPTATATTVADDRLVLDLAVDLATGITAMVGTLTIPLPT